MVFYYCNLKTDLKLSKSWVKPSGNFFAIAAIGEHANLSDQCPSGVCALEHCRRGKIASSYFYRVQVPTETRKLFCYVRRWQAGLWLVIFKKAASEQRWISTVWKNLTFIHTGADLLTSVNVLFPSTWRVFFSVREKIFESQSGLEDDFLVGSSNSFQSSITWLCFPLLQYIYLKFSLCWIFESNGLF